MFADLTGMIEEVNFTPMRDSQNGSADQMNETFGRIWLYSILKVYRVILCGYEQKNHMREKPKKMTREEFNVWRLESMNKLLSQRPDSLRMGSSSWLIHYLKTTEIVDGTK